MKKKNTFIVLQNCEWLPPSKSFDMLSVSHITIAAVVGLSNGHYLEK